LLLVLPVMRLWRQRRVARDAQLMLVGLQQRDRREHRRVILIVHALWLDLACLIGARDDWDRLRRTLRRCGAGGTARRLSCENALIGVVRARRW
jgi:predicted nucleotidyltransferase